MLALTKPESIPTHSRMTGTFCCSGAVTGTVSSGMMGFSFFGQPVRSKGSSPSNKRKRDIGMTVAIKPPPEHLAQQKTDATAALSGCLAEPAEARKVSPSASRGARERTLAIGSAPEKDHRSSTA